MHEYNNNKSVAALGRHSMGAPRTSAPPPGAVRRNLTYEAAFDGALCMGHPRGGFQTCHCRKLKEVSGCRCCGPFQSTFFGGPPSDPGPQAVACLACTPDSNVLFMLSEVLLEPVA